MKIENENILKTIFRLKGNLKNRDGFEKEPPKSFAIADYLYGAKSAVTISADFELAWAFRGRPCEYRFNKAANGRRNVPFILNICERFDMPVTWATVGHLFLDSCSAHDGKKHPDMPRPPLNSLWEGDWYKHDPMGDYHSEPYWYAPDLVELILASKAAHEIGTHTFSHIDFSESTSNQELVSAEIKKCIQVMRPFGLVPKTIVFPFNHMGSAYEQILYDLGIIAARYRDPNYRLIKPEKTDGGLYRIYESMNLRKPKHYQYKTKAKIFIERAIEIGGAYHLWFHPSDPQSVFDIEFREILSVINKYASEGMIWKTTMCQLAAYCEARDKITLSIEYSEQEVTIRLEHGIKFEKFGDPEITITIPEQYSRYKSHYLDSSNTEHDVEITINKNLNGVKYINIPASTKKIVLSI